MGKIRGFVVLKNPGEAPTIDIIETKEVEYEYLRKSVKGYIERICIGRTPKGMEIDLWLNEEGKLNGMKPNLQLPNDVICGPILICWGTRDGRSIPFADFVTAAQIATSLREFRIKDPDSVEVPEPLFTIHTFGNGEDFMKELLKDDE